MKKMIAASLACLMTVSPIMAAEAAIPEIHVPNVSDQEAHKGENNVPVTLDILRQNKPIVTFSVTVPTSLPLVMDLSGNVKTATNAQVKNNSTEDVVVTDVNLKAADGWTLAAYDGALKDRPADTKELGMEINTCKTNTENLLFDQEKFPTVKAKDKMPVTYNALLPRQKTAGSVGTVANSVFVIGWADPTVDAPLKPNAKGTVMSKAKLDALAKNLTGTVTVSTQKYQGEITGNAHDVSEAQNGSVVCVVDGQNATVYGENGVLCPNIPNYWNISSGGYSEGVFANYQAKTIDVSGLDTSQAPSLYCMFYGTKATEVIGLSNIITEHTTDITGLFYEAAGDQTLDFTGVNTSNVIDMGWMFHTCKVRNLLGLDSFDTKNVTSTWELFENTRNINTIDMSSFDLTNVSDTSSMLSSCSAKTIYCRNQSDLNKLKASAPSSVHFIIGKP